MLLNHDFDSQNHQDLWNNQHVDFKNESNLWKIILFQFLTHWTCKMRIGLIISHHNFCHDDLFANILVFNALFVIPIYTQAESQWSSTNHAGHVDWNSSSAFMNTECIYWSFKKIQKTDYTEVVRVIDKTILFQS